MQRNRFLPLAAVVVTLLGLPQIAKAQSAQETINVDGLQRTYLVHVPPSYDKAKPSPVVLVFHGGGGNAQGVERITGMDQSADKHGFVVVYPEGIKRGWNDGRPETNRDSADVPFIGKSIDALQKNYNIDPKRVYACGISNGGFFSQHVACNLGSKIAAVASVAASTLTEESCKNSAVIPIMFMLGDQDPLIPYTGGKITVPFAKGDRGSVLSAAQTVKFWIQHNHCESKPSGQSNTNTPGAPFYSETYSSANIPDAVKIVTIRGGGHAWPGGKQYLPKKLVGTAVQDVDANEMIWAFFQEHSR